MGFDIRRDCCWWPTSVRLPSLVDGSIVNQEGWERDRGRTSNAEKYEAEIRKQKNNISISSFKQKMRKSLSQRNRK